MPARFAPWLDYGAFPDAEDSTMCNLLVHLPRENVSDWLARPISFYLLSHNYREILNMGYLSYGEHLMLGGFNYKSFNSLHMKLAAPTAQNYGAAMNNSWHLVKWARCLLGAKVPFLGTIWVGMLKGD